jgi:hypothetical protein
MSRPLKNTDQIQHAVGVYAANKGESKRDFCERIGISVSLYSKICTYKSESYIKGYALGEAQREARDARDEEEGRIDRLKWLNDRDAQRARCNGDIDPLLR